MINITKNYFNKETVLDQEMNEIQTAKDDKDLHSIELAVHNVVSITRKTRTYKADELQDEFKVVTFTLTDSKGVKVEIKAFLER
jgi:hypothetical protein